MFKRKIKGFTLVELLVVIGIIGVILAVSIPSYILYNQKAKAMVGVYGLISYTKPIEMCFMREGNMNNCSYAKLGMSTPIKKNYIKGVLKTRIRKGVIIATLDAKNPFYRKNRNVKIKITPKLNKKYNTYNWTISCTDFKSPVESIVENCVKNF